MARPTLVQLLRRWLPVVAIVVVGLVLWADMYRSVLRPAFRSQHFPTSTYWVAPRMVWDGRGDELYDTEAFAAAAVEYGASIDRGFIPNAPPAVLPLLPFGLLPEAPAYFVWTALSLASVLGAVALLLRLLGASVLASLGVVALLPLYEPLRLNFQVGQAFTFVLLAIVAVAVRSEAVRGLAAAGAAILKSLYGLVMLAPAVIARRWRELAIALGVLGAACLVSVFIVGIDGWRVWLETTIGWRSMPGVTVTAYQTLTSLFGHLFRYEPIFNPTPVTDAPLLENVLFYASAGALVLISVTTIARRSSPSLPLPIALLVPVAILVSPIAEDYHYVLMLLPITAAGAILLREPTRGWLPIILFVAALVLLVPAWPFEQQPVDGWSALLYYPRVYGALLLWAALLVLSRRTERA